MPNEVRVLTFTFDELRRAFTDYGSRLGVRFPVARIEKVSSHSGAGTKIILHLREARTGNRSTLKLEPNIVAACMIAFCRGENIPLARQAKKSLEIVDGKLAFWLRMEANCKDEIIVARHQ